VALVERHTVQRDALVPDRAQHQLDVQRLQFPGALEGAVLVQPGPLQGQPGDLVLAGDLHRPEPEPQVQPARVRGGRVAVLARGPLPDGHHVAADPPVGLGQFRAGPGTVEAVQVGLVGRDDDLDAGQFPKLSQFLGGELGVGRAAPADHVDLAYLAGHQGLQHRLRHVRGVQVGRVAGQDAGHVDGHVPDPDDRDRLGVEGERGRADVRVPAVPVDEVGGRVAAGQVLAGDAQPPVAHGPGGVHHGVVGFQQVGPGHVLAEVHAADEPHVRAFQHLAQVLGDRLYRLVVGGDPVADQPVRGGQPVQHVHPHPDRVRQRGRVLDQCFGRVEPGGT
jgi:hypothetical protein